MNRHNAAGIILYFLMMSNALAIPKAMTTTVPEVVVKVKKANVASKTSGPKISLSSVDINQSNARTVGEALQNLGGLKLSDITGNGSQPAVSLRGFGSNATSNTLLLINGIPLTNPDLASPNLNLIPLPNVQLIEIIAGSESVLYGDQAVGGVINIITQGEKRKGAQVSCSLGSYKLRDCYGSIDHHYRELEFNLFAGSKHSNNYRHHNDYIQNQLMTAFNLPYASGRIRMHVNIGNEYMQYPGALTAAQVFANRRQANNDTDFFKNTNNFFHLQHRYGFAKHWQLNNDVMFREMQGHGVFYSPFDQSRRTLYYQPQIHGKIDSVNVLSGLELQQDDYQLGSAFGLSENKQQKYAGFLLANLAVKSKLNLSMGLRAAEQLARLESTSNNNTINRALATTLGANYTINPNTHLYLRRAGSYRFPKADENAPATNGIGSLRTQRGIAYETGLHYKDNAYTGNLDLYQLNLRDEIAFDPTQTPEQPFGTNRNLSPTIRRGISIAIRKQFIPNFAIGGQYNYVNARFQNGINVGKHIPLVAENIFLANITYSLHECWHLYSEFVYTGSQFPANDVANLSGRIGGYALINAALHYDFKNISLSLHLNNIFNKAYYLYTVFQSSNNQVSFYPAPERNALLSVKYIFN